MKLKLQINPVTLKELRQLVRSRIILWGMVALPIVLLIAMIVVLSDDMHGMSPMEVMYGNGLGGGPLAAATVITAIVTCGLIPLFTCIKTMIETSRTNERLEFTTALTSSQIASGKIAAAAIISAIAVALAMPFFALSYLMRGIELSTTVAIPALLLLGGTATTALGLLPACSRRSIVWKILLLILLGMEVWLFLALVVAVTNIGNSGELDEIVASILLSLAGAFAAIFLPVATTAYCRAQAAAELAPPHTDFARTLRITQIVMFVVGYPLIFAGEDPCAFWSVMWTWIAGMIALGAASRPLPLTRGAVIHAPRLWLLRVLAFPFATGSMPSMFFAFLLATASTSMLVLITGSTLHFNDTRRIIVLICECFALVAIAGSIARVILDTRPRLAKSLGKIAAAYFAIINGLQLLTELDVMDRDTLWPFPCCIEGVRRIPNGHLVIAIVMGFAAICFVMVATREDFKRFRKL